MTGRPAEIHLLAVVAKIANEIALAEGRERAAARDVRPDERPRDEDRDQGRRRRPAA